MKNKSIRIDSVTIRFDDTGVAEMYLPTGMDSMRLAEWREQNKKKLADINFAPREAKKKKRGIHFKQL